MRQTRALPLISRPKPSMQLSAISRQLSSFVLPPIALAASFKEAFSAHACQETTES
jgi:hypothetical protein